MGIRLGGGERSGEKKWQEKWQCGNGSGKDEKEGSGKGGEGEKYNVASGWESRKKAGTEKTSINDNGEGLSWQPLLWHKTGRGFEDS